MPFPRLHWGFAVWDSSETMKPDIRRWPLQVLIAHCSLDNLAKLNNLPAHSYFDKLKLGFMAPCGVYVLWHSVCCMHLWLIWLGTSGGGSLTGKGKGHGKTWTYITPSLPAWPIHHVPLNQNELKKKVFSSFNPFIDLKVCNLTQYQLNLTHILH